jgi:hypothetical protein
MYVELLLKLDVHGDSDWLVSVNRIEMEFRSMAVCPKHRVDSTDNLVKRVIARKIRLLPLGFVSILSIGEDCAHGFTDLFWSRVLGLEVNAGSAPADARRNRLLIGHRWTSPCRRTCLQYKR